MPPIPPLEIFHLPLTPSLCLSSNHSQYFCVAIVMHQTSTPSMHVYPHHDNNPFCNYSTNSILAAVAAFLVKAKSESARVEIRRTSKIPRWPILIRSPPLRHASWRRCSFDALTPDFFFTLNLSKILGSTVFLFLISCFVPFWRAPSMKSCIRH